MTIATLSIQWNFEFILKQCLSKTKDIVKPYFGPQGCQKTLHSSYNLTRVLLISVNYQYLFFGVK